MPTITFEYESIDTAPMDGTWIWLYGEINNESRWVFASWTQSQKIGALPTTHFRDEHGTIIDTPSWWAPKGIPDPCDSNNVFVAQQNG